MNPPLDCKLPSRVIPKLTISKVQGSDEGTSNAI